MLKLYLLLLFIVVGFNRLCYSESIWLLENFSFWKFIGNGGDGFSSMEFMLYKRLE